MSATSAVIRYLVRARSSYAGKRDIVRVYSNCTTWMALEAFVEDVRETHAGWDRASLVDITVERVS